MTSTFWAHSAPDGSPPSEGWHPLKTHLQSVGNLSQRFASGFSWFEEAYLAGMLHDLGKYGDLFQKRLKDPKNIRGVDHWSAGAWLALSQYRSVAASLAIQGHHIGLQKMDAASLRELDLNNLQQRHPLGLTLSESDLLILQRRMKDDGLAPDNPSQKIFLESPGALHKNVPSMLDVRFLFSTLVDADFLDTEAHFQSDSLGKRYRKPGPSLSPEKALDCLQQRLDELSQSNKKGDVSKVRQDVLKNALCAAEQCRGLYTLTAPTGSGKTLAMLAFALKHAQIHGLERIILAIPYLSILEQTAGIYRSIFEKHFGEDYLIEDHSLADLGIEKSEEDSVRPQVARRRLLSENWDAPLILTTNVQLLESLFSNRPSSCRKLHRLSKSVILFDEVQSLPLNLVVPTLTGLSHLSDVAGTTIVFATATQPAFTHLDAAVRKEASQGWAPREIVQDTKTLFDRLRRTAVKWPADGERLDWGTLAEQLKGHRQVLCVLNLKRHATTLLDLLKGTGGIHHLSTNLCPAHRAHILKSVKHDLLAGNPCLLVSTQCIEAGVDVDFPAVYRAMAPLDAIAQAAGRCNREGRSARGQVSVFRPALDSCGEERQYPSRDYYQAARMTELLLSESNGSLDIEMPETFTRYYKRLYDLRQPGQLNEELQQSIKCGDFVGVANHYRLIKKDAINIVVPYAERIDEFQLLKREAEQNGLSRSWVRRATPLAVSLFRPPLDSHIWPYLIPVSSLHDDRSVDWYILAEKSHYDPLLGLAIPDVQNSLIA